MDATTIFFISVANANGAPIFVHRDDDDATALSCAVRGRACSCAVRYSSTLGRAR